MKRAAVREEEIESRWEAAPAVAVVILLQLLLALVSRNQKWSLWVFEWWVWLIPVGPETLLLATLAWQRPRHRLEQLGLRRMIAIALLGWLMLATVVGLVLGASLRQIDRAAPRRSGVRRLHRLRLVRSRSSPAGL